MAVISSPYGVVNNYVPVQQGFSPLGAPAPFQGGAVNANPAAQMLQLLLPVLVSMMQTQQGWGAFGGSPAFGQPVPGGLNGAAGVPVGTQVPSFAPTFAPTGAYGGGATGGGAGLNSSVGQFASPPEALQRYINAVDSSGGVNNAAIGQFGEYDARSTVVNGYASEFYAGGRLGSAQELGQKQSELYADFSGQNGANAKEAATFALVASRFKNANGSYNKNQLSRLMKATGNADLIGDAASDVGSLSGITAAIKRGTLDLNQLFDPATGKDALGGHSIQIADKDLYNRAIKAVTQNPPNLGTSIVKGEAGAARPDLLSHLGGGGRAGKAGNAGNAGGGIQGIAGGIFEGISGLVGGIGSTIGGAIGGDLGTAITDMTDLATDTLTDVGLAVTGKIEEGIGLVGKLVTGDIGGAIQGAVGLVTESPVQLVTLLSGKLDDAVGIIGSVAGGGGSSHEGATGEGVPSVSNGNATSATTLTGSYTATGAAGAQPANANYAALLNSLYQSLAAYGGGFPGFGPNVGGTAWTGAEGLSPYESYALSQTDPAQAAGLGFIGANFGSTSWAQAGQLFR